MNVRIKQKAPIILPVAIKGERTNKVYMIMDTGARVTMLSWEALEFCGYKPYLSRRTTKVTTANGVIECPLIKVKEISLGGFKPISTKLK